TCTCLLALTIGIVLPSLFRPGRLIAPQVIAHLPQPPTEAEVASETAEISDIPLVTELPDLLQRLVPVLQPAGGAHRGMLSLVFAAFLTGLAVIRLAPERRTLLIELCSGVQEICLTVVSWLLPWAPWAVFGLLAKTFGRVERGMLAALAVYMATVGTGLYVLIALYAGVLRWMTGRSPWHFVRGIREIQMLAFSTSSPVTVLPLTLRAAGGELGVRAAVAEAVLPICAVMNMDTVALYQATATVFLAQVYGITVNPLTLALVILGAVLASLGTPSTPGLGIIVLTGVLARMGVPAEGILLVIGVDRILDMSRSGVHVLGDLVAASVVDHWVSAEDLSLSPHPATTPPVPINPS
ncbi:MAG: dicarboxylate/amino acid:cation symporter, partial [bacterium]